MVSGLKSGWREVVTQPGERGKFIVFEGIDGAGTTTHSKAIAKRLQEVHGEGSSIWTYEPSVLPVGQFIRTILRKQAGLDGKEWCPPPQSMAYLFFADRVDHVNRVIEPNIFAGRHVICDRYLHSTFGYQALTSGTSLAKAYEWLAPLCRFCTEPDLVIVLNVNPEEAFCRRSSRAGKAELYEVDELQRDLAKYYAGLPVLRGFEHFPAPGKMFYHIDANRSQEEVFSECVDVLHRLGML